MNNNNRNNTDDDDNYDNPFNVANDDKQITCNKFNMPEHKI